MLEKIKEGIIEFFKDPREEELATSWNEAISDYRKELNKRREEYRVKEEEYWTMSEKDLLREIAVNTLRIRKHFELN